ncbi:hypothetical protein WICMUC_000588 [Wickerhamomyces mucosus]|uniref:Protein FMP25, mitochondrial n=1 Tax=Wickerhamomyces mucosus TaxID=1378264 RepID=A0A9P8PYF1_9ASCO|nr:hypothetical protein WICMUC_000588 [Wickerhamomyces mucosus]
MMNVNLLRTTVLRSRSIVFSSRCLTSSPLILNKDSKLTSQKYDEAQLMSAKLNEQPYYAKRNVDEYYEREEISDRPATAAELQRHKRIEALKGLLAGIAIVAGIIGSFTAYQKWPAIQSWWNKQDTDRFEQPKKFKKEIELPILTDRNDSSVPGLYIWGDNLQYIVSSDKSVKELRNPIRHPWFDNKLLKFVTLGEYSALAIDINGDLIQWGKHFNGDSTPKYTIKGENLKIARISNGIIFALNGNNEILKIAENESIQNNTEGLKRRNWLLVSSNKKFNKLSTEELDKDEKIVDLQTGKYHLLALTNKGKVYTTSTGLSLPKKSFGQYGIPENSQFGQPPSQDKLHEVTLLNQEVSKTFKGKIDHVEQRIINKIATGDYHSLALDNNGEVFSFGKNTYGQLGHPVSYNSEIIGYPKKIELIAKHIKRDQFAKIIDINAGGETSFCTVSPIEMHKLIKSTNKQLNEITNEDEFTVGFGNNLKGQIGSGHYVHAQFDPVKVKELTKFEDFNETTNQMERVKIAKWSTGKDHTFIKLENKDVLYFGGNDFGQLGNGKKNRIARPTSPPALIEPSFVKETYDDLTFANRLQLNDNQEIVAGETASAIFYTSKR